MALIFNEVNMTVIIIMINLARAQLFPTLCWKIFASLINHELEINVITI
jgi:hypothetical protein